LLAATEYVNIKYYSQLASVLMSVRAPAKPSLLLNLRITKFKKSILLFNIYKFKF